MELAERWHRTGEPFTREDDAAMYSMIQVASRMAIDATTELFGPAGRFTCPHRAAPMGTSTPVDGGYLVRGQWDYCSGVGHATHFMCNTLIPGRETEGPLTVCTPSASS